MEFDIEKHTIFKCVHGSRAYGTHTETSDYDYKGIAIAPMNFYLGFSKKFEQSEKYVSKGHGKDEVIYDLKKFMQLGSLCNPNIIEILFVDEQDILYIDDFGKELRQHRDLFLSKNAKNTFCGYAISQLKRIRTHRKWILDPPTKKPERQDFGLPIDTKMTESEIGAFEHLESKGEKVPDHVMHLLQKEKQYANKKREWDQYQNWKKTRNKERAKLEAESKFDTKHAMHLVRLLRMGKEILSGQGVLVKRPDAEELLAIRNGAWTYEQVSEYAEEQIAEIDILQETSPLPKNAPINKLDDVCMDLILNFNKGKQ